MTDYHVGIRVRNGRILKRMREKGIDSARELSRRADCGYQQLINLMQMKESPLDRDGNFRLAVLKMALVLECQPEDLFNEQQLHRPLKENSGELFMDTEAVGALMAGGIGASEAKLEVQRLLGSLNERERQVVELRLEGATYEEVAQELSPPISLENARRIEIKATAKMRREAERSPEMRRAIAAMVVAKEEKEKRRWAR